MSDKRGPVFARKRYFPNRTFLRPFGQPAHLDGELFHPPRGGVTGDDGALLPDLEGDGGDVFDAVGVAEGGFFVVGAGAVALVAVEEFVDACGEAFGAVAGTDAVTTAVRCVVAFHTPRRQCPPVSGPASPDKYRLIALRLYRLEQSMD